ncbi:hypothetical protein [Desulfosporosinus orientis]|nr:hypothetical protein [Desulfosporosinus orientis]
MLENAMGLILTSLDCFNYPVYLANSNEKLREMVAARLNVPIEKAVCQLP